MPAAGAAADALRRGRTQEREKFMTTLRSGLHISPEQHHAAMSKLEQDESVMRIRCAARASCCGARARATAPRAVEP